MAKSYAEETRKYEQALVKRAREAREQELAAQAARVAALSTPPGPAGESPLVRFAFLFPAHSLSPVSCPLSPVPCPQSPALPCLPASRRVASSRPSRHSLVNGALPYSLQGGGLPEEPTRAEAAVAEAQVAQVPTHDAKWLSMPLLSL